MVISRQRTYTSTFTASVGGSPFTTRPYAKLDYVCAHGNNLRREEATLDVT